MGGRGQVCSRLGAPGWSVGAFLSFLRGQKALTAPAAPHLPFCAEGCGLLAPLCLPGHQLLPMAFQLYFRSSALLRDGQCHGGHSQPVGGRWVGILGSMRTMTLLPSIFQVRPFWWCWAKMLIMQDSQGQRAKGPAVELSLCCKCRPPSPMSSHSFGLTTDQSHGPVQQILHGHRHELRAGLRRLRVRQRHKHLRSSKLGLLQSDYLLC